MKGINKRNQTQKLHVISLRTHFEKGKTTEMDGKQTLGCQGIGETLTTRGIAQDFGVLELEYILIGLWWWLNYTRHLKKLTDLNS